MMNEGLANTADVPGPPTAVAIDLMMSLEPDPTQTVSGAMS
jgi:hypothetical protein